MQQLLLALFTVIVGVGGAILYFYAVNWVLDLILPPRGPAAVAARNQQIAATIRPWLFLGPALLLLGLYLVYPVVDSVRLSLYDRTGEELRRLLQLRLGVRRHAVPRVDRQQHPLADRGAGGMHRSSASSSPS